MNKNLKNNYGQKRNNANGNYINKERRSSKAQQPKADSETLRPVFAAYFNMARANLYNVLRYISTLCNLEIKHNEDSMVNLEVINLANDKKRGAEIKQKAYSLIMRHIPVLRQMTQAVLTQEKTAKNGKGTIPEHLSVEQKDLEQILKDILYVINYQRNYFTHANHYDTEEEQQKETLKEKALYNPLETAFMGSKREVKSIFGYSNEDMNFVDQEERMKKIKKLDKNGDVLKDERGREQYLFVEQPDWYFRLFNSVEDKTTHLPKPVKLTTAGLVFLLCKLLHKKYATQLIQQTGLLSNSPFNKQENEIMFNIFCAYNIRLPKGRMESTTNNSALGLDMLNELQKCPAELFETLSPEDRKLFQLKRNNSDETMLDADDDINIFRRNGDRFPRLALRYIDSMRESKDKQDIVLKDIVFQISLGTYRHKFYNRASLDTDEKNRVRVLQKEINGFGPIDRIEQLRKEQYASIIRKTSDDPEHLYDPDTADTQPYLTDHHASYAITGNRIGLTWNVLLQKPQSKDKRPSIRFEWNDGTLEKLDNDKCFLPNLPKSDNNVAPRAWLSIHDLPALIFLHLIGGNPETVIKETYNNYTSFLNDIREGILTPIAETNKDELDKLLLDKYRLHLRYIPKKIAEYLLGCTPMNEEEAEKHFIEWVNRQLNGDKYKSGLISNLKNRIEQFEQNLKLIGDKQNRIGRKGYVDVRAGSLSRYIAKDIMDMTRPDPNIKNNGKPSGLDYNVLQAAIATFKAFGEKLKDTPLGSMLQKAINVNNHPFLNALLEQQVKDTIDLYRKYQNEKINYLQQLSKGNTDNFKNQWFLREAYRNFVSKTPDSMKGENGLADRYIETLQLPNGLFTEAVRNQLNTINNKELKKALDDEKKKGGVTHLINSYFINILKDDSQPFYREMRRHYKVLDWANFKQTSNKTVPILPTLIPPEQYHTDEDIAKMLRKDNKENAPIFDAMDEISGKLQTKIGIKKLFVNGKKRIQPDYGDEGSASEEEKDAFFEKLMHLLRNMQRNERTIRRYRNEDMLLFLMARKLLLSGGVVFKNKAIVDKGLDQFKLQNIQPPAVKQVCDSNLLEQMVDFSLTINLNDENGKPIVDADGNPIQRTISQEGIKIKNYGDFFAFLYDSRIGSLLSQLDDSNIDRSALEDELDNYDRKRKEVFRILQEIERQIIKQHPEIIDNNSHSFLDKNGKPYRNSFSGLLSLCKHYLQNEDTLNDEAESLVDVRNAFSHNRYTSRENKTINIGNMYLPEVAKKIVDWLETHQKQ